MDNNVIRPTGATADRVMARLGSSLHVKGEISGNEDLCIDGTVEGLVHLDERKLTVGATAELQQSYSRVDSRRHCWRGERARKREG